VRLGRTRLESKYLAIQSLHEENNWSINWMCKGLGVSHSAYYKWLHREVPDQELENQRIAALIREYDDRFGHILGYRRMTLWINHFNGTDYKVKRIHRIMKSIGIHAIIRAKRKQYERSTPETVAENTLKRDFHADKPNEKWTTDVTEFKIPEVNKKLYLSAILDLYDRTPVSYVRGFQYTSKVFKMKLQEQGMEQSMSRVGHCIDNGPTEGFWGIIKTEMYCMFDITDEASLRKAIAKYMDFYTNERPQERFDGKTPAQVRQEAMLTDAPKDYPIPENKRIQKYKAKWAA